ncbi:unnamed protein product [Blepharisma stoltei]|uniref:Alanine dehydrogenase/pyridine nucleotide transhydrogenase N-terminal domain-containing protein n=1 Tax=Blepharisma stoltei TaxID=1481888 RepID=A0AAU9IP89_9CILI|nr:unnamed protein product [Blepharisma stoltei]
MEGTPGTIGLRRETKTYWERRVAITPKDVTVLINEGIRVLVQPSPTRCFSDIEFLKAGAEITEDLSEAQLIIGIKEVPIAELLPNRSYLFFSHTYKGQPYNMPLLDALLEKRIRLFDYELIKDVNPPHNRLVAFGVFAGNAGVIDFIQGLGKFLLMRNISTPFILQGFSYMYRNLADACQNIRNIGEIISKEGFLPSLSPMIFGVTGTGRCAEGAMQILTIFPHEILTPEELLKFEPTPESRFKIYIVQFPSDKIIERKEGGGYDREEFHENPELYQSTFIKYAEKLSVIVHCAFWSTKQPRLLTIEQARTLKGRLLGICDISCDFNGGIQICRKFTTPEDPFYLYCPTDDRIYRLNQEHAQTSILYHSMDFLPSELPRDASEHFSHKILGYVRELAWDNANKPFEEMSLHPEIKHAMETCHGDLTPSFQYIKELRKKTVIPVDTHDHVYEMGQIISKNEDLLADLENTKYRQGLIPESENAIYQLSEIIEDNNNIIQG